MLQEAKGSETCPLHPACSKQVKPSQGDPLLAVHLASLVLCILQYLGIFNLAIRDGASCENAGSDTSHDHQHGPNLPLLTTPCADMCHESCKEYLLLASMTIQAVTPS